MSAPRFTALGRIARLERLGASDLASLDLALDDLEAARALAARIAEAQAASAAGLGRPWRPRGAAPSVWRRVPPFDPSAPVLRLIGPAPAEARPGPRLWRARIEAVSIPLPAVGRLLTELRLIRLAAPARPSFRAEARPSEEI